jgi:hypothetical protein
MKILLVAMLTAGAVIALARAIDNNRTLHVLHLVVGDAE